ncbi:hypothetical protein SAMN05216226_102160 [Halovenus aranensis]|uniref:Uncharacterized protein n=1 Tax=Halovenus aranensis TaxID=890420 RepID=A0A1G8SWX9_9EURY|nr:hypothetical protein [Halovenus aranensis]SDJ33060.1 hypothetical protein SAMN05216226_102160 [Halovenus aranensis]
MAQRSQALWRILALLYGMTIAAFISGIVTLVGFIWMLVDIPWQLITGRNDLSEDSGPASLVSTTILWNTEMLIFSLTGGGPKRLVWLPGR